MIVIYINQGKTVVNQKIIIETIFFTGFNYFSYNIKILN